MRGVMREVVAVRHVPFEDLGAFAPVLMQRGFAIRYHDAGDALDPEAPERADLLVILGGPIGVHDRAMYPFLNDEIGWIAQRLERRAAVMGVCLGAQLMAAAAGARVYRAPVQEIGFAPVMLTPTGARSCLAPFAEEPMTLHWHGDTFDLPDGAELLASTAQVPHQAFSLGRTAIAFQFHPEASPLGFERWLIGHALELAGAGIDPRALRADMKAHGDRLAAKAAQVMGRWLDQAGF